MTMLYQLNGAVDPIVFSTPVKMELEPVYKTVPAITKKRSADEMRCAAMMLEKLRRREDVAPDDFIESISEPYDGERVVDAVVGKLIDVL